MSKFCTDKALKEFTQIAFIPRTDTANIIIEWEKYPNDSIAFFIGKFRLLFSFSLHSEALQKSRSHTVLLYRQCKRIIQRGERGGGQKKGETRKDRLPFLSKIGGYLLSHFYAVPSAWSGLTSLFGMGRGGSLTL